MRNLDAIMESREYDIYDVADNIDYNGASHRGGRIPAPIKGYINQANIPDNVRLKDLSVEVIDDNTLQVSYITQEPFDSEDADVLIAEIRSAVNIISKRLGVPVDGTIEIESRDGRDYGYAIVDIHDNKDESLKEGRDRRDPRYQEFLARLAREKEEAAKEEEEKVEDTSLNESESLDWHVGDKFKEMADSYLGGSGDIWEIIDITRDDKYLAIPANERAKQVCREVGCALDYYDLEGLNNDLIHGNVERV